MKPDDRGSISKGSYSLTQELRDGSNGNSGDNEIPTKGKMTVPYPSTGIPPPDYAAPLPPPSYQQPQTPSVYPTANIVAPYPQQHGVGFFNYKKITRLY